MKRILLVFVMLTCILLCSGCEQNREMISAEQIIHLAQKNQIKLSLETAGPIHFGEPMIYKSTTGKNNYYYIYEFDTIFRRNNFTKEIREYLQNKNIYEARKIGYKTYTAKNILLIHFHNIESTEKTENEIYKLDKIFFDVLNNGKTKTYQLNGENWSGKYVERYYSTKIINKNGFLEKDSYYEGSVKLTYIGSDLANVKNVLLKINICDNGEVATNQQEYSEYLSGAFILSDKIINVKEDVELEVLWNDRKEKVLCLE